MYSIFGNFWFIPNGTTISSQCAMTTPYFPTWNPTITFPLLSLDDMKLRHRRDNRKPNELRNTERTHTHSHIRSQAIMHGHVRATFWLTLCLINYYMQTYVFVHRIQCQHTSHGTRETDQRTRTASSQCVRLCVCVGSVANPFSVCSFGAVIVVY